MTTLDLIFIVGCCVALVAILIPSKTRLDRRPSSPVIRRRRPFF